MTCRARPYPLHSFHVSPADVVTTYVQYDGWSLMNGLLEGVDVPAAAGPGPVSAWSFDMDSSS